MIRPRDRKIAQLLLKLRLFYIQPPTEWHSYRCYRLRARKPAQWIWDWMLRRQTRDGLHHAPMCPGNEWAGVELVFQRCNCGAAREAKVWKKSELWKHAMEAYDG